MGGGEVERRRWDGGGRRGSGEWGRSEGEGGAGRGGNYTRRRATAHYRKVLHITQSQRTRPFHNNYAAH